jgi:hypothetical protein
VQESWVCSACTRWAARIVARYGGITTGFGSRERRVAKVEALDALDVEETPE